jgi:hypothetical protein
MTIPSAPPSASAIRDATLALHRDVRLALARGLRAIAAARTETPGAHDELSASAEAIAAIVRTQIVVESEHLTPILAELDAWGAQRLQRMTELHAREQSAASQLSASNLHASIRGILRALRLEEKELLDADLLDDSLVVRECGGG